MPPYAHEAADGPRPNANGDADARTDVAVQTPVGVTWEAARERLPSYRRCGAVPTAAVGA